MNPLRNRSRLLAPLLGLMLLLGQWAAVVHASQHELATAGKHQVCEICLSADAGGAAPPPPTEPLALVPAQVELAPALPHFHLPARKQALPQGRAPPAFPV